MMGRQRSRKLAKRTSRADSRSASLEGWSLLDTRGDAKLRLLRWQAVTELRRVRCAAGGQLCPTCLSLLIPKVSIKCKQA